MSTLANLRDEVRRRADMEKTQFVTDTEINSYINNSYAELYDILVSRFADYYITTLAFSIAAGSNTYTLPSDFYKIHGLDFEQSGITKWVTVYPFNFVERNRITIGRRIPIGRPMVNYRVMGTKLIILPPDFAAGNYQMWYVPRYSPLTTDASTLSDVLDFQEYIVVDAAMKCLIKEESDISALMAIKQQLKARIEAMAANRDSGSPERIGDVQLNRGGYYPFEW